MQGRERLIELLKHEFGTKVSEITADYLLANGVIVPPCKVGDTVYCIAELCGNCECFNEPMREEFIETCRNCEKKEIITCAFDYELIAEFGKTVFCTREEAEAALAEQEKESK